MPVRDNIGQSRRRRVRDDPGITNRIDRFDQSRGLEAIQHWHRDVHDDHRRSHLVCREDSLETIAGCPDDEAGVVEQHRDEVATILVVVDDEDRVANGGFRTG
jgi:hypothetical protein